MNSIKRETDVFRKPERLSTTHALFYTNFSIKENISRLVGRSASLLKQLEPS